MSDPQTVVDAMIAACERKDMDGVLACFHEDVFYHNVPFEPVHGHDGIRAMLGGFLTVAEEIDWPVHKSVSNGVDLVMNERTDRFRFASGWAEVVVMGVFEVREGKIAAWRDYFDSVAAQPLLAALA